MFHVKNIIAATAWLATESRQIADWEPRATTASQANTDPVVAPIPGSPATHARNFASDQTIPHPPAGPRARPDKGWDWRSIQRRHTTPPDQAEKHLLERRRSLG